MSTSMFVRQEAKQVVASFTRPDDTTAYASGDVVANSTTAAAVMTFANVVKEDGHGGVIRSVMITDGAAQATKLNADLFIFHTAPASYGNDNEAFVPTDAEMQAAVAVISIDGATAANTKVGDATVGIGGNCIYLQNSLAVPFQCAAGERDLFGVLIARNAYTPVALETFQVKLSIELG